MSETTIRRCPDCRSTAVDGGELAESVASCRVCDWRGTSIQLTEVVIKHDYGVDTDIIDHLIIECRNVFMRSLAEEMGGLLVRFGFIDPQWGRDKALYYSKRYAVAIARGVVEGILKAREAMERDDKQAFRIMKRANTKGTN